MKMFVSIRPAEVNGHIVKVACDFKPADAQESVDIRNINEAKAFLNDYIRRNVKEGHKYLCIRKNGRAFSGFNDFYKSIPVAVDATTRL